MFSGGDKLKRYKEPLGVFVALGGRFFMPFLCFEAVSHFKVQINLGYEV